MTRLSVLTVFAFLPGCNLLQVGSTRALRAWKRSRCAVVSAGSDSANNVDAANAFLQSPRPASGKEAFDGSTWSVLLRMNEGGSTIFTMQLLEDETCRFSDSELFGSWECEGPWVVVEKPKGFFDLTLFLSAKLVPPSKERPKWRLVDGIVQSANRTDAALNVTAEVTSDDEAVVELSEIGTFSANEFEEALLTTMRRFQTDKEGETDG